MPTYKTGNMWDFKDRDELNDAAEQHPCPKCKKQAHMESCDCYYEYYKCSHCKYEFKVS